MPISTSSYREQVESDRLKIIKTSDDSFVFIASRFNPATGKPDKPETISKSLSDLKKRRDTLTEEVDGMNELIADLEKMK